MINMKVVSALLLLVSVVSAVSASSGFSKVRRVRAGKVYAEHDAVHIVVNKVG